MNSRATESHGSLGPLPASTEFSLVLGGPLFQLLRRARLTDDGLMLVGRRMVVISLVAWLPLLLLCALKGQVLGESGSESVAFLRDLEVHIRLLVVMPLLIGAELVVHRRMRSVVQLFVDRGLIPQDAMARFNAAIASAFRLRNSILAEVLLIALVYGVGVLILWRQYVAIDTAIWYTTPSAEGTKLSRAGIWYALVSMPVLQFLLARWYFRIFIWVRFLWQVSRIELRLMPAHPDHFGGLGFLANIGHAFVPVAAALGALLAGMLANRIFLLGANFADFKSEIAIVAVFNLGVVVCPLLLFSGQIAELKRAGILKYGTLTARHLRRGEGESAGGASASKASAGEAEDEEALSGAAGNYDAVQALRIMPVTRDAALQILLATLLPVAPLALTVMPLADMVKTLLGLLF
jgi:hypothetical protein